MDCDYLLTLSDARCVSYRKTAKLNYALVFELAVEHKNRSLYCCYIFEV